MSRRTLLLPGLVAVLIGLPPGGLSGQEVRIPPAQQYPLLTKIMQYDRNLSTRSPDELLLGVLYQDEIPESVRLRDEFLGVVERSTIAAIGGIPIRVEALSLEGVEQLGVDIRSRGIDVVYLPPLRARAPEEVCRVVQESGAICVTAVNGYAGRGVAVGISDENGRPVITVDLDAARAQGADFSSQLLRVARVIGGRP